MRKRQLLISSILLIVFFSIGTVIYVNADSLQFLLFKEPQTQIEKDSYLKHEQDLNKFRSTVINDISQSFNLNLDGYTRLSNKDLVTFLNQNKSFGKIFESIKPEVGDTIPYVYLNEHSNIAYILKKKHDGTNEYFELTLNEGNWEIVNNSTKASLPMEFEDVIKNTR